MRRLVVIEEKVRSEFTFMLLKHEDTLVFCSYTEMLLYESEIFPSKMNNFKNTTPACLFTLSQLNQIA